MTVLTYHGQFLVVSIWQSTLPNQFPNLGAMWIKYCFHTIVWRMAAICLGLNVLTHCCWSKIAFFCRRHLNIYFRICFTFAYAIVILKNEFEIMVCKISAMPLPGCVNTLWQWQSDLYFEDNIFNIISNFRWNLKWQSCFGCNVLRARQNGAPFKMIYSNKFSCIELFHYFFSNLT